MTARDRTSERETAFHDFVASVICPAWVRTRIMEVERNRDEAPRPTEEIPAEALAPEH